MIDEKKIIQEFKKSLWYDASEEPKKDSKILYKDDRGYHEGGKE